MKTEKLLIPVIVLLFPVIGYSQTDIHNQVTQIHTETHTRAMEHHAKIDLQSAEMHDQALSVHKQEYMRFQKLNSQSNQNPGQNRHKRLFFNKQKRQKSLIANPSEEQLKPHKSDKAGKK
jgi:hypothetical protein